jgi:nucleotide-binding universal stress UspA family protein
MEAADAAAAMAKALGQKLILAHAAEGGGGDAPSHAVVARCGDKVAEEARRLRKSGVTVEGRVVSGSPADAIAQLAESSGAQFVIVSSIGQVAPSRFLAGSVAERTAESSHVPTLIVREAGLLMEWARRKHPLRVVVGCDFSLSSDSAIQWALGLRSAGRCEIIVVHVNRPAEDSARLGTPTGPFENAPVAQRVLVRELSERVKALGGDDSIVLRVAPSWGRVDAELLEAARREQAHLVVVGTHQRHGVSRLWLGSVSRAVLRHASSNVAIVPADRQAITAPTIPDVRRVLVTTDLSEIGNSAIAHAYSVLPHGGTVCLLHVSEGGRGRAGQRREAESKLRNLVPADAARRHIETTFEILPEDDVPQAIYHAAERFGADMICIASHGRTGLLRTLLGSVAQAVVARSGRPVLLIRAQAR